VVLRPPAAIELAERLAGYAPGDLNRVFFTTGGGEAVETAWKLAKQYFKLTGKPMKHKVISRAIAYHGTTQGALSITGLPALKAAVRAAGARHVPGAEHQLLPRARARRRPEGVRPLGRRPDRRAIEFEGPTPSPRSSSSRCRTPAAASRRRPGYFQRVREICDEYDVLLVSDEVICAFGRLGTCSAASATATSPT
jgi:adenosylmethionine-8-amino-7-oxononanoate aminotransferase